MVARLPPIEGGRTISPRAGQHFEGLTGPSYKLDDKSHPLPNPKSLRPYVDTRSGDVDTWPAHASGQAGASTMLMLSKNKSLILYDEEAMGKPKMIPKPRFLEQLESYLKKELRALGVTDVNANELRLQAHREVFEYLIEDFKTYKPLLSGIKNEYEMMLAYQRQVIRELEPLKQMLVTVSEQCDQKIMSIREEEKQEIKDLKAENKRLLEKIQSMQNERLDLVAEVKKLEDDLAETYKNYRDELDSKKLLLQEMNDMRDQKDDLMASKESAEMEAQDDPVTLKIALRQAREDEKNATKRLNDMITNYYDVIPRRDFETLEAKHNALVESTEILKDDFDKLKLEHDTLLDIQKQVTKQRDEFYVELEQMKRASTPRPDWEKCADVVSGGVVRWKELSDGKTSNDLVDVLLSEIQAGGPVDSGGAEYFDGQGTGPSVPKYLRFDGPVRNRRLGKRDCLLLIRDIWREKAAHDASKAEGEKRDSMADFLDTYLSRRFAMEQMKVEWAYNLHDACQKYSSDELVGLFWGVLENNVDEEIYHDQMTKIEQLLNQLTSIDVEKGNPGKITKNELISGIQTVLPNVDEESMAALVKGAELELDAQNVEEIDYKEMFKEDDEGRFGPFLDEVLKWMKQDRLNFGEEVKQKLEGTSKVEVDEMKQLVTGAAPNLDTPQLLKILAWVYETTPENVPSAEAAELSRAIERLQNCHVPRS